MTETTDRMTEAKARYSRACELVLQGHPDAARLCDQALRELKAARLALIRDAAQRVRVRGAQR